MFQGKGFPGCRRIPRVRINNLANSNFHPETYFGNGIFYGFLVHHITFVSHKQFVDAFCCVSIDFLQPLLDIVERVHICYIVDHTNTMSTSVVRRRDGSESFLTSSIPLVLSDSVAQSITGHIQSATSPFCRLVQLSGFSWSRSASLGWTLRLHNG